eukprot:gene29934-37361_t
MSQDTTGTLKISFSALKFSPYALAFSVGTPVTFDADKAELMINEGLFCNKDTDPTQPAPFAWSPFVKLPLYSGNTDLYGCFSMPVELDHSLFDTASAAAGFSVNSRFYKGTDTIHAPSEDFAYPLIMKCTSAQPRLELILTLDLTAPRNVKRCNMTFQASDYTVAEFGFVTYLRTTEGERITLNNVKRPGTSIPPGGFAFKYNNAVANQQDLALCLNGYFTLGVADIDTTVYGVTTVHRFLCGWKGTEFIEFTEGDAIQWIPGQPAMYLDNDLDYQLYSVNGVATESWVNVNDPLKYNAQPPGVPLYKLTA